MSRSRSGQWRYSKSENTAGGGDDPHLTLSWFQLGENSNISGYCTTGELFCFLGSSSRKKEHSKLFSIVAGQVNPSALAREKSDALDAAYPEQHRNKIAGRSRSNTLTHESRYYLANRSGDKPTSSDLLEDGVDNTMDGITNTDIKCSGVFIDGVPLSFYQNSLQKKLSYLEPNETSKLYKDLTVLETLVFSSQMRQEAKVGVDEIRGGVQPAELNVLRLLTDMGFKDWAETKVGDLENWQRRMVLFATEAVAGKNALLFNFPTTDLDVPSALSLVTALQRAAKGGRLVAMTATSLTFREYAMLDKIQLLSSNGSIYFGAVSGAMNYFASLQRTPSPGASISDFLLDLVDDELWPGGYSDAHLAFLETEAQKLAEKEFNDLHSPLPLHSATEASRAEGQVHVSFSSERGRPSSFANAQSYQQQETLYQGSGSQKNVIGTKMNINSPFMSTPLPSAASFATSPTSSPNSSSCSPLDSAGKLMRGGASVGSASSPLYVSVTHSEQNNDLESMYDSFMNVEWLPSTTVDGRSDSCTGMLRSSASALQFLLCLWRAFLVRWRGLDTIMVSWAYNCSLVSAAFILSFCTASGINQKVYFLTFFPYSMTLLLNLWNDKVMLDRHIFVFERNRGYFHHSWMPQLASLFADILAYHMVPPLLASCFLYLPLGLRQTWSAFGVFTGMILLICVVAACFSRALYFALDILAGNPAGTTTVTSIDNKTKNVREANDLQATKAASFTATVLSVLVLFTGTTLNLEKIGFAGGILKYCSFFFWGSNVLYWNEWTNEENPSASPRADSVPLIDVSVSISVLCTQLVFYVALVALCSPSVGKKREF